MEQTYEIIDRLTGYRVGKPYKCRKRARTRADRLDNEYGAYRYSVRQTAGPLSTAGK